jgi:hypothetical protein
MRTLALLTLAGAMAAAGETRYARLGDFEGTVEVQLRAGEAWLAAGRNLPLGESTWLRTGAESRLEVELDEGSAWRLGAETRAAISDYTRLSTGQRITLLSLDQGMAWFSGQADGPDSVVLSVLGAQVTVTRAARVRLEVRDQTATIAVLSGSVRFSSPVADMDLREGQTTRVEVANPSRFFLLKEIAARDLDRWCEERDEQLASSTSSGHVAQRFGRADLDRAGTWVETETLGTVWKPKVEEGWAPFRAGTWRWYEGLGYTWVSGETWGWLPYHYGRWAQHKTMGWVWAPGRGGVFKPGEVYWRRGDAVAGWGPLAPGELYPSPDPEHPQPQQFLAANTTWAAFAADAESMDPAGFDKAPKDPLKETTLVAALPSPALVAARLDARRPPLEAGRVCIVPIVDSVTFETASVRVMPPPPQPIVIITQPAPPPKTEVVEVPVPYAVPVGIPIVTKPAPAPAAAKPAAKPPALAAHRVPTERPAVPTGTRPRSRREMPEPELRASVEADFRERSFEGVIAGLDIWKERFPRSPLADLRQYYYLVAYDALNQSEQVIAVAGSLLERDLTRTLDTAQIGGALFSVVKQILRIPSPRKEQLAIGARAATGLLTIIANARALIGPAYSPPRCPDHMSRAECEKAEELERLSKQVLELVRKSNSGVN